MNELGTGKRFNADKVRVSLISPHAAHQIGVVMTEGAKKYGARNWEKGMDWSKPLDSLERHLNAYKRCEDFDPETGALHMAHVAVNAMFICEYYKTYPMGDDRIKPYMYDFRIGLDIDEVLADFVHGYMQRYGLSERPKFWNFDKFMYDKLNELSGDKDFWMSLMKVTKPEDLQFEPVAYITSRPMPESWSEEWLMNMGFPSAPVLSTHVQGKTKSELCKQMGIQMFIDDSYHHFKELNANGVFCYLFSASHNERYDVGHHRIDSLADVRYSTLL